MCNVSAKNKDLSGWRLNHREQNISWIHEEGGLHKSIHSPSTL